MTRSFVARTINWMLFFYYFAGLRDEEIASPEIEFEKLTSIYREVPPGSLLPLTVVVSLIGNSTQRVAEFFYGVKDKNFEIDSEDTGRHFGGEKCRDVATSLCGAGRRCRTIAYIGSDG